MPKSVHKRITRRYAIFSCSCAVVLSLSCGLSLAAGDGDTGGLFSPSVGQRFYEIAYELANTEDVTAAEADQAIIFLACTLKLDSRAKYVLPEMIKLGSQYPKQEYAELVPQLLAKYVDKSADLEVVRKAISYLLGRLDSREQREKTLEEMLNNLGSKNRVLDSELATLLGLLMAEKADLEAAQFYLMRAYNSNKYNKLAFAKLSELAGEQIDAVMYLEHLRLGLQENPLDMKAALAFAEYAERLELYQTAADAYEYCADLFKFLYPSEALPAYVYLPWAISNYNTQRSQYKCLQIASDLRQGGRFDLLLEAVAGRAAAKLGDRLQAALVLKAAEDKAVELLAGNQELARAGVRSRNYEQLAWFYCFASPDPDGALEWANKAYSSEPNSANAASILAYSLVMNGQADLAESLVDNYEHNQIAALTLAQIQLAKGQQSSAIETLKAAIAKDPGSLAAERAKEILAEQGSEYISPVDPNTVLTVLKNSFGETVVRPFVSPEQIISVQLNLQGSDFYYGNNFGATVVITNNSTEPLIVSDDGLFKGYIRVDADVGGDLDKKIPELVSMKIRPALPIEPGRNILVPVRLVTGGLRRILLSCPQASLDIEFTVYLDPVTTAEGGVSNSLTLVKPFKTVAKRAAIELNGRYLQNRFNSLSKGRQGQKLRTAELFTGLLLEQHAMANREPLYKLKSADWMPALLKSALVQAVTDDDWTVRVHAMAGMVSLPLDYELISGLSENLRETHWPCRLMAIFLLAKSGGSNFSDVLDWTAKHDSNEYVRRMAIALSGTKPGQQEKAQSGTAAPEETFAETANLPNLGNLTRQPPSTDD